MNEKDTTEGTQSEAVRAPEAETDTQAQEPTASAPEDGATEQQLNKPS